MSKVTDVLSDTETDYGYDKTVGKELINLFPKFSGMPILVPADIPLEIRLRITAAVMSCILGNKSMDYTLKRYGDVWAAIIESQGKTKH